MNYFQIVGICFLIAGTLCLVMTPTDDTQCKTLEADTHE